VAFAVLTPLAAPAAGAPPAPDAYVIVIDTARRDAWQTYTPALPVGGALERLARDGLVFERLRAPTSWTRPAVATLLTGLPPWRHQVLASLDLLPADVPTLPALLRERGYRTRGWSSNAQILPIWGFGRGFEELVDLGGRGTRRQTEARAVFEAARKTVADAPVGGGFYYLHLVDPHYPYTPPPAHLEAVAGLPDDVRRAFAPAGRPEPGARQAPVAWRYLAEVRDADTELGRFLDFLRARKRYRDALILVVADHGEELDDHGATGHGATLYEEVIRVPGVLKLPGNARAGQRITRDVELHDLLATMAPFLGIRPPAGSPGVNVLEAGAVEAPAAYVLHDRRLAAVRQGRWKLIVDYGADRSELYDLAADPGERTNLADAQPRRVAALRALLDRVGARHRPGWHLRGCGCREPAALAFRVDAPAALADALDLEEADRVERGDGLAVHLDLAPNRSAEPGRVTGKPLVFPDRDELVLEGGASTGLRLRTAPGARLPLALGQGAPRETPDSVSLSPEAARVRPSEPVLCKGEPPRAAPGCTPHLRVWYTPPPDAVPAGQLDPELVERLRALGYELSPD
jgi:arylsulfatase A-like enzyme